MRYFISFLIFFTMLYARDNPFEPTKEFKEGNIKPTNVIRQYDDFQEQQFTLPNNARALKYIKIGYQILDGSIQEKKIPIEKSFDWHDPLILTKKSLLTPPIASNADLEKKLAQTPEIKKVKPIEEKSKIKTEVKSKSKIKPNNTITKNKEKKTKSTSFSFQDLLTFTVEGKRLIVSSADSLLRDFMVVKPYKIVLDFNKKNSFYTKNININLAPFEHVTFGSHGQYYRASFELDGPYTYVIHKQKGQIIIDLH